MTTVLYPKIRKTLRFIFVLRLQCRHCFNTRPTPPRSPYGRIVDNILYRILQHICVKSGQNVVLKTNGELVRGAGHSVGQLEDVFADAVDRRTVLEELWVGRGGDGNVYQSSYIVSSSTHASSHIIVHHHVFNQHRVTTHLHQFTQYSLHRGGAS